MKTLRLFAVLGVLGAAACGDDGAPAAVAVATPAPAKPDPGPAPGSAGPGGAAAPIPITAWIHDLVTTFGNMSPPDTVDDKNLADTEDPGAFDNLLQ